MALIDRLRRLRGLADDALGMLNGEQPEESAYAIAVSIFGNAEGSYQIFGACSELEENMRRRRELWAAVKEDVDVAIARAMAVGDDD